MADTKQTVTVSFPWLSLLGIAFVVLKLTEEIDWPWVWVLAPFWIPFAILAVFLTIFGVIFLGAALLDRKDNKRRAKARAGRVRSLDRR